MDTAQFIRLSQAAKIVGVCRQTVFRWATDGTLSGAKLEARKIGGFWYTTAAAIDRFIAKSGSSREFKTESERAAVALKGGSK